MWYLCLYFYCILWQKWRNKAVQSINGIKWTERSPVDGSGCPYLVTRLILNSHDDVIKWKHFPRYWPFVRGIHRSPVKSHHKGQWRGALIFSLSCAWRNGWVNNHAAGDLRRHRAHYDVTVMLSQFVSRFPVCWRIGSWDTWVRILVTPGEANLKSLTCVPAQSVVFINVPPNIPEPYIRTHSNPPNRNKGQGLPENIIQ